MISKKHAGLRGERHCKHVCRLSELERKAVRKEAKGPPGGEDDKASVESCQWINN